MDNDVSQDFYWRKCDEISKFTCLDEGDICIYARENRDGGYGKSLSNQLIFNLKKPITNKGQSDWHHKEKAVKLFAKELSDLKLPTNAVLIPDTTSKPKNHKEYDSRILDALYILKNIRPDIKIEEPIEVIREMQAAHKGGSRDPAELIEFYKWIGFSTKNIPSKVFFIDDVITTGGHFKTIKNLILKHHPEITVYGIFWARHIFSN